MSPVRKSKSKKKSNKGFFVAFFGGGIGFVLSPLSWWNDVGVNIPLAALMTWPIVCLFKIFQPVTSELYLSIFVANYWITNFLGVALMHFGLMSVRKTPYSKMHINTSILITTIYTFAIVLVAFTTPLADWLLSLQVVPDWVIQS